MKSGGAIDKVILVLRLQNALRIQLLSQFKKKTIIFLAKSFEFPSLLSNPRGKDEMEMCCNDY